MRRVWAAALVAGVVQAASLSVLDPLVQVDVVKAPLGQVLSTLSAQTGLELTAPGLAERVSVTLTAVDQPLRAVLRLLCERANLVQYPNGRGGFQFVQAPPTVGQAVVRTVAPYRLGLGELAVDRSLRLRFDGRPYGPGLQTTRLELLLDADTNVKLRALLGLAPDYQLSLDGVALQPLANLAEQGTQWGGVQHGLRAVQLLAQSPTVAPTRALSVKGTLLAYLDARERVFEFGELTKGAQQQTDGDIDVALTSFVANEAADGGGYTADLTLSMPLDDTLAERLRTLPQNFGGRSVRLPVIRDAMAEEDLAKAADRAAEAAVARARAQADELAARAAEELKRKAVALEAAVRAPDRGARAPVYYGPEHPFLPAVLLQGADGRQRLLPSSFALKTGTDAAHRLTITATYIGVLKGGAPRGLLVGAVDFGRRCARVPFEFKDVPLPPQP